MKKITILGVAQLVERLVGNQEVAGSSPSTFTSFVQNNARVWF